MAKEKIAEQAEPVKSDDFDEITYLPEDGDPVRTYWNGLEFKAHVPTKVSRRQTVLVLERVQNELPDGSLVSRSVERRRPMVEQAKGNPRFMVNGVPPQARNKDMVHTPETSDEYRGYALRWIVRATDASVMDSRWSAEEALRGKCGCDDRDVAYVRTYFEAHLEALGGKKDSQFMGPHTGMREVVMGLTPGERHVEAQRAR